MTAVQTKDPYTLLREIESRSQQKALGIPQQLEIRRTWSGVGFRVGEIYLVSAMDEVSEILTYPSMTKIPSAYNWVRGLANIRGILLPIMDFTGVIDGTTSSISRTSRVLMVRHEDMQTGLVVDEVFGMRHFFDEDKTSQLPDMSEQLRTYMKGAYRKGDQTWGVFSMLNLVRSDEFRNVASRGQAVK